MIESQTTAVRILGTSGRITKYGASDRAEKPNDRPAESDVAPMMLRRACNKECDHYGRSTIIRWPSPRDVAAPRGGDVRIRLSDLDAAFSRLATTLSRDDVRGNGVYTLGSCSAHLDKPRAEGTVTNACMRGGGKTRYCPMKSRPDPRSHMGRLRFRCVICPKPRLQPDSLLWRPALRFHHRNPRVDVVGWGVVVPVTEGHGSCHREITGHL